MITRGEIAGKILRVLQKTPQYQGFYTNDRIDDAIEDCMDYIATMMFIADEGWQTKIRYLSTNANQISVDVPADMVLINHVRYLFSGEYLPLNYVVPQQSSQVQANSGLTQYASTYRIVDNKFYFNPPLAEGGENYLMVEYTSFPKRLQDDNDFMELQFAKPMSNYIKWRACSQLVSGVGKSNPEWLRFESEWFEKCRTIITTRNTQMTYIKEFDP